MKKITINISDFENAKYHNDREDLYQAEVLIDDNHTYMLGTSSESEAMYYAEGVLNGLRIGKGV